MKTLSEARVFARQTKATPRDGLAFTGPPGAFLPPIEHVSVSCTFTWDIPRAEWLAEAWRHVAPVDLGGPAFGKPEGDFEPGRFLQRGYVITSRGCPNRCWFCRVWRRQPEILELPIRDGWNVQDDNLLACCESHIRAVFEMLRRQPQRPQFSGGLEAARLCDWHVNLLVKARPESIYLAYDTPSDLEPLIAAAKLLKEARFCLPSRVARCYVLIGSPKDNLAAAETRLKTVLNLGLTPFAMLYQDGEYEPGASFRRLQRRWARPAIIFAAKPDTGQSSLFDKEDAHA